MVEKKNRKTSFYGTPLFLVWAALCVAACGTEAGSSWEILKDTVLTDENALVSNHMGFVTPERGFAHAGNTILTSADGGATWTTATATGLGCIQSMEIIDERTVVFDCTCAAARMSNDRGASWDRLGLERCLLMSFRGGRTAWGANYFDVVSYNAGNMSGVKRPSASTKIIALASLSAERACMLNNKGELSLVNTGGSGAAWETLPLRLEKDDFILDHKCAAMRFKDETTGLLLVYDKSRERWTTFLTRDGGQTWKTDFLPRAKSGLCFIAPNLDLVTVKSFEDDTLYLFRPQADQRDAAANGSRTLNKRPS